jgi:hypothetical protein
LPDPENSDAGWFAFKECMAKPGIKEAWFEVKQVTFIMYHENFVGERIVLLMHEIHEKPEKYGNVKNCTYRHEIKFQFSGLMPEHQHRSIGSNGSDKGKKK